MHAGAEDNACLPVPTGQSITSWCPMPQLASTKLWRETAVCQMWVQLAGCRGTLPPPSKCLPAFGVSLEGSRGWEWGPQMYPALLALAPSHLGVPLRMLRAGAWAMPAHSQVFPKWQQRARGWGASLSLCQPSPGCTQQIVASAKKQKKRCYKAFIKKTIVVTESGKLSNKRWRLL